MAHDIEYCSLVCIKDLNKLYTETRCRVNFNTEAFKGAYAIVMHSILDKWTISRSKNDNRNLVEN